MLKKINKYAEKLMQQWKSENRRWGKAALNLKLKTCRENERWSRTQVVYLTATVFFFSGIIYIYIYYKHLQEVMTLKASHCGIHDSKIKTLNIKKLTLGFPKIIWDAEDKELNLSPNVYEPRVG